MYYHHCIINNTTLNTNLLFGSRGKDEGDNLLQLLLSSEGAPQWKNEAQGLYHPLHLSTKTHYEIARPRRLTQMQEARAWSW